MKTKKIIQMICLWQSIKKLKLRVTKPITTSVKILMELFQII